MAKEKITKQIPTQRTRAEFRAETFNAEDRTIEVTFASEAAVRTFDWDSYEYVDEVLVCTPEAGDLTRLNSGAPALDNHNRYGKTSEVVVGVVESARFENGMGVAKIRFGNSEDDEKLMNKVKDKIVTGVSVGYNVSEYQVTRTEGKKPLYRATKWEATEISFTPVQADINSRVRSDNQDGSSVTIEDVTPEAEPVTTEEVTTTENTDPPTTENPTNENNEPNINENNNEMTEEEKKAANDQVRAAERARIQGIRTNVRALGLGDDFAQQLIEDDTVTDLAVAGARALAEWEKLNPITTNSNTDQQRTQAEQIRSNMTNALVLRVDPKAASVMGEENVRNAAEFKGMNLLRFAEESLIRSGVKTNGMSQREIATAALGGKVRGLHHSTDFPLLLMDTVNRTLLAQYAIQARTFQVWASRATMNDFRPVTRARLTEILGNLEEVKEGQEYKYDTMSEYGETYQLAKFGKIIGITWEAIVNDDLSAFTRIPQAFSVKAAQKQSDIVYKPLLTNPDMADGKKLFSSDHGNFTGTAGSLTAGGTALSEASLSVAYKMFRKQKGPDGSFLNISPKFLIVGPELELLARKLTSTNFVPAKQTDISLPALTGLIPVIEPRLEGYEWFLAADPTAVDTIEYAFLDGEEELFIDQREGFNIDGIEVKARMIFAAKAIDWRGLYRNNGAAS